MRPLQLKERDNLNIDSLISSRRKAVQESLKEVGAEELKKMAEQIFPYVGHPWEERFSSFLQENAGATFYHALAEEGVHVLYCPAKAKGIWYRPGKAVGIVQPQALAALKEIIGER